MPNNLVAGGIRPLARALRQGSVTIPQIVEASLESIHRREDAVQAWVTLDEAGALRTAQVLQAELLDGKDRGLLHGMTFGIKDIIDVKDLPTIAGAPWRRNMIAQEDAAVVKALRDAGAVILGKTTTTQFALYDPCETRNPLFSHLTPGGSSAGSAAAVAADMCVASVGTQTGGSLNRPASYCGVVALKPEYGKLSTEGVIPVAPSLDTVGFITRTIDDARIIHSEVVEKIPGTDAVNMSNVDIRRLAGFFVEEADSTVKATLEPVLTEFQEIQLPFDVSTVIDSHLKVAMIELEEVHREWFKQHRHDYKDGLAELIQQGADVERHGYLDVLFQLRNELDTWLKEDLVLVCPATATLPPHVNERSTGNPRFNSRKYSGLEQDILNKALFAFPAWTFLGVGTVSFPIAATPEGVPICLQVIGRELPTLFGVAEQISERFIASSTHDG